MYLCVCHALTDHDVRRTRATTVGDAYRSLGVRPTCGKCVPFVQDMVRPLNRKSSSGPHRE
ncbi:MAG: (2Fe-2S)-binding protein [Alphaproteobacteria bacterium]|nr:(2Fe-2S)-binding protein [Alphaproteobacteria bacterium]